jgi:hypothetical protein
MFGRGFCRMTKRRKEIEYGEMWAFPSWQRCGHTSEPIMTVAISADNDISLITRMHFGFA